MWPTVRLSEFGTVVTGKTPSSKRPEHFGELYPFITPTDMDGGRRVVTERQISEAGADQFRRQMLPENSVCFVCIGATIGKICMTSERSLTNQQINSIVVDASKHDPFFVHYLLSTYSEKVKSVAGGAATPIVNKTAFERIEAVAPPLPTQRKIAAILSTYDDLIENNLRRIKILEEMAQTLYREWFVKFRFPGCEKVRMVDSPLGKIPEGWEVCLIGKRFQTVLGGTPLRKKTEYWTDGTVYWINSGKVNDLRVIEESELITDEALRRSATKMMPVRTTLVAITGATLGQVSLLEIEACANQSVVGIYDKDRIFSEWIYHTFSERIVEIVQHASGGAQQHINKGVVEDMNVILPPLSVMDDFNFLARPLFDSIANKLMKNVTLRRTRELLLPRLISGELDVEGLGINIGATRNMSTPFLQQDQNFT
jgi:type I restriction enzyme S subunit